MADDAKQEAGQPLARFVLRLLLNVPFVPSLMTSTSTKSFDPYRLERSSKLPALLMAVTPVASLTRLMASAT